MALVDYGSESDSDQDDDDILNNAKAEAKNIVGEMEDDFFAVDDLGKSSSLSLPSAMKTSRTVDLPEGELEEIVQRKDWELKLAEKHRKKLEKKAKKNKKKEKKEKKHKKDKGDKKNKEEKHSVIPERKGKAKISAFGALSSIAGDVSDSDEEDQTAKVSMVPTRSGNSGLISMLPAPRTGGKVSGTLGGSGVKGPSILLPSSLQQRKVVAAPTVAQTKRKPVDSDSDSDGGSGTDFFGLTASASEAKMARTELPLRRPVVIAEKTGPLAPSAEEYVAPWEMYNMAGQDIDAIEAGPSTGQIDHEGASRLIAQHESGAGMDRRMAQEMAAGIVDANVDEALGPNVRSTLLKNLHHQQIAKSAMSIIPKTKETGGQVAKRKHQITYLANMAIAREEALQEEWSQQRVNKNIGRSKYGF